MGLEVGCPTTTDHVAGNAAGQKSGGGADHPVAFRLHAFWHAVVTRAEWRA
jgi:hypothetical protein